MASWTCNVCGASASGTKELVDLVSGNHTCPLDPGGNR